jgi:hypothetical protein
MDNSNLHQPQRLNGESYEAYIVRRKASNTLNKLVRKGFMFWNPGEKGTFRKNKEN